MQTNALRLPFLIGGIYSAVFGVIQSIPPLAERVFGRPITDPAIESIWGVTVLGASTFYFIAASDSDKYKALSWGFLSILVLVTLDSLFYWSQGGYTASTIVPFILLNVVLIIWLFISLSKKLRKENMLARFVTANVKEGQMEALRQVYHDALMNRTGSYSQGNKGSQLLLDKENNKALAFSLWEDHASLEAAVNNEWNEKLKEAVKPFLEGEKETKIYEVGASANF